MPANNQGPDAGADDNASAAAQQQQQAQQQQHAVTKAGLLTSKYTGVCWNKKNKRWQASINSGGKCVNNQRVPIRHLMPEAQQRKQNDSTAVCMESTQYWQPASISNPHPVLSVLCLCKCGCKVLVHCSPCKHQPFACAASGTCTLAASCTRTMLLACSTWQPSGCAARTPKPTSHTASTWTRTGRWAAAHL